MLKPTSLYKECSKSSFISTGTTSKTISFSGVIENLNLGANSSLAVPLALITVPPLAPSFFAVLTTCSLKPSLTIHTINSYTLSSLINGFKRYLKLSSVYALFSRYKKAFLEFT